MSGGGGIALLVLAGLGGWLLGLAGLVVLRQVGLAVAAAIARDARAEPAPAGPAPTEISAAAGLEELALELLAQTSIRGRRP